MRMRDVQAKRILALVITTVCLSPVRALNTANSPDRKMQIVRFDAVVELGAPTVKSHAIAFVRYWVSSQAYVASIVWAEPHVGSLNFSGYPVSVSIESTRERFHLTSQTHDFLACEQAKPIPPRGPFCHKLNVYALGDMRFAERDALATRVYKTDLNLPSLQSDDAWEIITIPARAPDPNLVDSRDLAKLHVRREHGQVQSLRLYDVNDQMLKSIDYVWSHHDGQHRLAYQKVVLPERPICIGFNDGGLVAENGTDRYVIKTMNTTHHMGERHCTIWYAPFVLGETLLSVPQEITVATPKGSPNLRAAGLFNFTAMQMTLQEMRDQADQFGHFTAEEMTYRQLLQKYWMKPASALAAEDRTVIARLVEHFEERPILGMSPGERLKQINMLFSMAMILDNGPRAIRHFNEYLSALTSYDLHDMSLLGGSHMIDIAVRWQHFAAANRMLSRWVNSSEMAGSMGSIKRFLDSVPHNGHLWQAISLIDVILPSVDGIEDQSSLYMSKTLALRRLCEYHIAGAGTPRKEAQIGWTICHVKFQGLLEMFDESIEQTQQLLAQQDESQVKADMCRWLDKCREERDAVAISGTEKGE